MLINDKIFVDGIENSPNVVVITDKDGIIQYINKIFISLTGYTKEDVIGKHTRILKSGETPDYVYSDLWLKITSGQIWKGRFHNKKKNGAFYTEDATISPIYNDENTEIIGFIAIKEDITEKLKYLEEIEDKNKFIERITNTSPNVIYLYDLNYKRSIYINKAMFELCGYTSEEIKHFGNTLLDKIVWKEDLDKLKEYHENIKKQSNDRVYELEYRLRHKAGHYVWIITRDTIFERDDKNIPSVILGTIIDITERKENETNLLQSNQTKDKLFSIISHDLKSPFTGLVGYTQLLYDECETLDKEDIKNFSFELYNISRGVNDLIHNLLSWSQLQSNKIMFDPIQINLYDFLQYIFNVSNINASIKNIQLINNVDRNINVYADEKMLHSIIHNLITNSIKFTQEGGKINIYTKRNFYNRVCVYIEDNGIGISNGNIKRLFSLSDKYLIQGTNKETGTGLGLIIVKEFIERHNGEIKIESEEGKGTTVSFDIELYD